MSTLDYLRSYRIGEYAIFDFAVSFIGMALLAPLLTKLFLKLRLDIPKKNWIILTLPISILVHIISGRITPFTANFINLHDHYILKLLILGLLIWGLRDIKITAKK